MTRYYSTILKCFVFHVGSVAIQIKAVKELRKRDGVEKNVAELRKVKKSNFDVIMRSGAPACQENI